jgi:hypothetical protein
MKYFHALIILILTSYYSYSQSTPEDKFGAWYMLDANHRISDKFSVKMGFQLRSFEVLDNINLLLYYASIDYDLNKNTTLTFGYSYLDIDNSFTISGENHLYENRPYEQLSYKHKISKTLIYQRLRLEHRLLDFKHKHTIKHRLRYRLGTKITLSKTLFINLNNEVFANIQDNVFTENRLYIALGFNISNANSLQLGYLNHEINKQNLNRLQVGLFFKTDLRKKKN